MYEYKATDSDGKEYVEWRQTWDEILKEAYIGGVPFVIGMLFAMLLFWITAPFMAAHAAYDCWRRGGKRFVPKIIGGRK